MMIWKVLLILSFPSLALSETKRFIRVHDNKRCVAGPHEKEVKLGKNEKKKGMCKQACLQDELCVAMQYEDSGKCKLWYNPIEKLQREEGTYCGRLKVKTPSPTNFPTVATRSPTSSPTLRPTFANKKYIIENYTVCAGEIDWERARMFKEYTSRQSCQVRCSAMRNCRTYQWNGKRNTCVIFKYRPQSIPTRIRKGPDRVCAIVRKDTPAPTNKPVQSPTKSPVRAATKSPTRSPVVPPTKSPVKSPVRSPTRPVTPAPTAKVECTLRAHLGFDFDDPDDAGYYGYHFDYLEVTEVGDYYYICSEYYDSELPYWCTYKNSDPAGTGASVANLDDYYYYDDMEAISTETIEVFDAAGRTFDFAVYHEFFDVDYYTSYYGWEDHMLAAVLTIENKSNPSQKQLNAGGWTHPTNLNIPTHIQVGEEWKVNPAYQGHFKVNVRCDDKCLCRAVYSLINLN